MLHNDRSSHKSGQKSCRGDDVAFKQQAPDLLKFSNANSAAVAFLIYLCCNGLPLPAKIGDCAVHSVEDQVLQLVQVRVHLRTSVLAL